ncbi:MAG TPA: Maf family protein [Steroidobacteraceae bacterium]|jgi:septum formation protein|nr:Maf family protein [Steroidobacteraceae bacterium]
MILRPILLASASPRRSALLRQIFMPHEIRIANIDESRLAGESPADYVTRLSRAKAERIWNRLNGDDVRPVLGADTTVALGDEIFSKPRDRDDGIAMLQRLSGVTHQVYTAVALCHAGTTTHRLSVSQVSFKPLSLEECAIYWNSGEPADKAGGYAVQGLAASFITNINGSYSGVMGLPLAETSELLSSIGWSLRLGLDGL